MSNKRTKEVELKIRGVGLIENEKLIICQEKKMEVKGMEWVKDKGGKLIKRPVQRLVSLEIM